MNDLQLNDQQRQAVQSLLLLENNIDQIDKSYNWNNHLKTPQTKSKPPHIPFNFVQLNKSNNPQHIQDSNFINKQRLLNLNKFKRARSLFDPMKIFKMGTRQLVYDKAKQKQYEFDPKTKRIIHKHPQQVRDLNFKSGHPTKNIFYNNKNDLSFTEMRQKSNQFINGQSVIIQVQSYEQNFNRKQVQYLMSKTMGAKNFRSHVNFDKKDDPFGISLFQIKSQDMKLKKQNDNELVQINKNGEVNKMSSKMRFTAYVNKKACEKDKKLGDKQRNTKSTDYSSSLDLKSVRANEQIAMSLRLLLNNLKSKTYSTHSSLGNTKSSNYNNAMLLNNINHYQQIAAQHHNNGGISKIFDKQSVFKSYEQQQYKNQRVNRMNKSKFQNELFKELQVQKRLKNEYLNKNNNNSNNNNSSINIDNRKNVQINSMNSITNNSNVNNDRMRGSSPRRYYQKSVKKGMDEKQSKIFNIKKIG